MQIEIRQPAYAGQTRPAPATDRNEILAVLAEAGLLPGPGIEGLLDRLTREERGR